MELLTPRSESDQSDIDLTPRSKRSVTILTPISEPAEEDGRFTPRIRKKKSVRLNLHRTTSLRNVDDQRRKLAHYAKLKHIRRTTSLQENKVPVSILRNKKLPKLPETKLFNGINPPSDEDKWYVATITKTIPNNIYIDFFQL